MFRYMLATLLAVWVLVVISLMRSLPRSGWIFMVLLTLGLLTPLVFGPIWDLGPKLPHALMSFLSLLTVTALMLCMLQLGFLALRLVFRLVWPQAAAWMLGANAAWMILLVGCGLGLWGFYQAARVPDVKRVEITIANLPNALKGFTIAQLTDTHVGMLYNRAWLQSVVEKTNALKADVIVVTGDVGEAAPQEVATHLEPLKNLHARDGVYFTLGNHETYQGLGNWLKYYEDEGLNLLRNSHVQFERDGAFLAIAGVDVPARGFPANTMKAESSNYPDVPKAFAGSHPNATRVLLEHLPQYAELNKTYNIGLQLSGHTHGAQIPPIIPLVSRANSGFYSGLYKLDDMNLYVSNGTGLWSNVPIRLFAPSEITLITLR